MMECPNVAVVLEGVDGGEHEAPHLRPVGHAVRCKFDVHRKVALPSMDGWSGPLLTHPDLVYPYLINSEARERSRRRVSV